MTTLHIDKKNHIFTITLDRPKANAMDSETSRQMGEAFAEFRDDDDMRVAILTSRGDKFFCAGWDLKSAAKGESDIEGDFGIGGFGGLQELPNLNKPIICVVNGICCGGGFEMALACDIILAAEHATFSLPENRSGTVAVAASVKLPKRIPHHIAMEWVLTGKWIDAKEAAHWGLVNHIYPSDELMVQAYELAAHIASGPPLVFAATKEIARLAQDNSFEDIKAAIKKEQIPTVKKLYASEDHKEGARAFLEKRDPVWRGH